MFRLAVRWREFRGTTRVRRLFAAGTSASLTGEYVERPFISSKSIFNGLENSGALPATSALGSASHTTLSRPSLSDGSTTSSRLSLSDGHDDVVDVEKSLFQKQYELETQQLDDTVRDYRDALRKLVSIGRGSTLPMSQRLILEWFGDYARAIDAEQALCMKEAPTKKKGDSADYIRNGYAPFLILLPPDKLAVIAMHEALSTLLLCVRLGVSGGELILFTALRPSSRFPP
jgi:hypothetical protein